jgi:hypothetical protein
MLKVVNGSVTKAIFVLAISMTVTACGGDSKSLAEGLGKAADATTSGIVCYILGC